MSNDAEGGLSWRGLSGCYYVWGCPRGGYHHFGTLGRICHWDVRRRRGAVLAAAKALPLIRAQSYVQKFLPHHLNTQLSPFLMSLGFPKAAFVYNPRKGKLAGICPDRASSLSDA